MNRPLKDVVSARLAEIGLGPVEAATAVGMEKTFIRDIVEEKKKSVRQPSMARLAEALHWTVGQLTAAINGEPVPDEKLVSDVVKTSAPFVRVRLQGPVEAGAFRPVDELYEADEVWFDEPRDPTYPQARLMAFDIVGTSMNALPGRPLFPGDRIICIDYEDVGSPPLRDGMIVVVQQSLAGGHLREWSVKQVALFDDRVEFQPRSTDPRHKPIVVTRDLTADDGREVKILAILLRLSHTYPRMW
ncbi:hypothetical protein [Ancylobacter oerskovii]|uniref:Uncharacterized protein n=1 Tax=Ancylobacter oerskovii TaxID=459519 RepID=A0ABW4Z1G7_9HYPH|nr:hypothetical protein [Ancylobacter oerskovii]MBS7545083.1 hypothetical protein [Ancylobacter oerskovii]